MRTVHQVDGHVAGEPRGVELEGLYLIRIVEVDVDTAVARRRVPFAASRAVASAVYGIPSLSSISALPLSGLMTRILECRARRQIALDIRQARIVGKGVHRVDHFLQRSSRAHGDPVSFHGSGRSLFDGPPSSQSATNVSTCYLENRPDRVRGQLRATG